MFLVNRPMVEGKTKITIDYTHSSDEYNRLQPFLMRGVGENVWCGVLGLCGLLIG